MGVQFCWFVTPKTSNTMEGFSVQISKYVSKQIVIIFFASGDFLCFFVGIGIVASPRSSQRTHSHQARICVTLSAQEYVYARCYCSLVKACPLVHMSISCPCYGFSTNFMRGLCSSSSSSSSRNLQQITRITSHRTAFEAHAQNAANDDERPDRGHQVGEALKRGHSRGLTFRVNNCLEAVRTCVCAKS